MKKSLLLISIWLILFSGTCHNNQNETKQTEVSVINNSAKQTAIKDTASPTLVGINNSDKKDASKKANSKIYPAPGVQDERKLDSLKKENDKLKK